MDLSSIDHELSEIDSGDKLHFPIILKHFAEIISYDVLAGSLLFNW